jgi:hypothetical protein
MEKYLDMALRKLAVGVRLNAVDKLVLIYDSKGYLVREYITSGGTFAPLRRCACLAPPQRGGDVRK